MIKSVIYAVLTTIIYFGGARALAEECDQVIFHNDATAQRLNARGSDVKRCFDLADSVAKASYSNTMLYCKKMALTNSAPHSLPLPSQVILAPSPWQQTWEDFAMTMGQDAASSGCRDGILSALQQILFLDTTRVRSLFVDNGIFLKDELVGDYEIEGPLGLTLDLKIASSTTSGRFLDMAQIHTDGRGGITFQSSPFQLTLSAQGSTGTFLGSTYLSFVVDVVGTLSGTIDSKTLTAHVSQYQATQVTIHGPSPLNAGISALIETLLQQSESGFAQDISRELTLQLKKSYQAVDPFDFLTIPR